MILILLLTLPGQAVADACDAHSQAARLDCLRHAASASALALRDAEATLATAIARWDEDAVHRDRAAQHQLAGAEAFARYRDDQCLLQQSLGGGAIGTGLAMRHQSCVAELNLQRAQQLQQLGQALPARTP